MYTVLFLSKQPTVQARTTHITLGISIFELIY